MKACNAMIAWTPDDHEEPHEHIWAGRVEVGPYPDPLGWAKMYAQTAPAGAPSGSSEEGQTLRVFLNFHTLVVRDGIDPLVAHQAFLAIDEYRESIAPDIPQPDRDQ